jgi:predicted permease
MRPDWRTDIRARLAPIGLRPERESEIVEELAQHLDDRYRDRRTAGATHDEAVAAAWREVEDGDLLRREVARSEPRSPGTLPPAPSGPGRPLAALWQDLRHAGRLFRRQPAFAAAVLVALALSIGPVTAVVSIANWLFWRPLAGVTAPDRLGVVMFGEWTSATGLSPSGVSYLNLADLKDSMRTASGMAGVAESSASLASADGLPRSLGLGYVTWDFFDVLGLQMAAGRGFLADEDRHPLGAPVVVISERLASGTFGSPAAAIDGRIVLNRQPFTIAGVAARGFHGITNASGVDAWVTGSTAPYLSGRGDDGEPEERSGGRFDTFVVRATPGATFEQIEAEFATLTPRLASRYPEANAKYQEVTARAFPGLGVPALQRPRMQSTVSTLMLIGGVLLMLGCANVANLLIARAIRRQPDLAIRKALGAGAARLVQAHLTEAWVLALAGAGLGLALAVLLKNTMQRLLFGFGTIPLDARVLGVTIAIALLTGTLAGLTPAWLAARGNAVARGDARTMTRAPRLRTGLAAVQFALSLALIVGALLLVTTLRNLHRVDLGFDPAGVSRFVVQLNERGYPDDRAVQYTHDLVRAVRAATGAAAIADRAPFGSGRGLRVVPPGDTADNAIRVNSNGVSDGYFAMLGTVVVLGREFTEAEAFAPADRDAPPVIVNELLARRLFGETDPLGRRVRLTNPERQSAVVGVVRDSHWNSVTGAPEPFLYLPIGRYRRPSQPSLLLRSSEPVGSLTALVHGVAARVDRSVPIWEGRPLSDEIDRDIRQQRLFGTMLTWLGSLAFVLAAVGLYGLMSQVSSERSREFGIRLALGATRGDIARLVLRRVAIIVAAGAAAGLVLAVLGTNLIDSLLFGVTASDPRVYLAAVALLLLVAGLATAQPAARATRVNPIDVLRAE